MSLKKYFKYENVLEIVLKVILNSHLLTEVKDQTSFSYMKQATGADNHVPSLTEVESNSSADSEPCPEFDQHTYYLKYSNEPFNEGLEQEVKLILEKVELAMDRIKSIEKVSFKELHL
jgi:hypothetical protein